MRRSRRYRESKNYLHSINHCSDAMKMAIGWRINWFHHVPIRMYYCFESRDDCCEKCLFVFVCVSISVYCEILSCANFSWQQSIKSKVLNKKKIAKTANEISLTGKIFSGFFMVFFLLSFASNFIVHFCCKHSTWMYILFAHPSKNALNENCWGFFGSIQKVVYTNN